jgi:hypothetical protein
MRHRPSLLLHALALTVVVSAPAGGTEPDLAAWDRVLGSHVRTGGVDYAALAADRGDLALFLHSLSAAEPTAWNAPRRIAFWVNAYNAVVLHFVLERYPGLESVRAVDGFFATLRYPVAGAERSLDEIEAAARAEGDPRVHFAVVCASASCPDLRAEAYRPEVLETQLEEQTALFLADSEKGLRFDEAAGELHLSSIFKWYAGDFTGGSTVVAFFLRGGLVDWVKAHVPAALAARIEERDPDVAFLDYDWSLNDR